jgi:hypothetical protein
MGKDWREDLAKCFEDTHILEAGKKEARDRFDSFCEIIADPAFDTLKEELVLYKVRSQIQKVKGQSITLKLNFTKSSICQFQYSIFLPKNSVQLDLKLRVGGRKNKKALLEENEFPFMSGIAPSAVLDIPKEDLIGDVIERYRNFLFTSITCAE